MLHRMQLLGAEGRTQHPSLFPSTGCDERSRRTARLARHLARTSAGRFAAAVALVRVLALPHSVVDALCRYQLGMPSSLHYSAVLENHDAVDIDDGAESVGDNDTSPGATQLLQTLLDRSLRMGIERGRRLVQEDELRLLEYGPSDGNSLFLSTRQFQPSFTDHRVVSIWERHNLIMDHGSLCCLVDFGVCSSRATKPDVIPYGIVEEHRILWNDANLFSKGP